MSLTSHQLEVLLIELQTEARIHGVKGDKARADGVRDAIRILKNARRRNRPKTPPPAPEAES